MLTLELAQQTRNVSRIVLTVAIESNDPAAARRLDTAAQGRALTAPARMGNDAHAIMGGAFEQACARAVAAAVIDRDHFVVTQRGHDGNDFRHQRRDVRLLVEERHHHRIAQATGSGGGGAGTHADKSPEWWKRAPDLREVREF